MRSAPRPLRLSSGSVFHGSAATAAASSRLVAAPSGDRGRGAGRAFVVQRFQIPLDARRDRPVVVEPPALEDEQPLAERAELGGIVADDDLRRGGERATQIIVAALLKKDVSDRQRFINDDDFRLHEHKRRKRQPQHHAGGVMLQRPVHELADLGKRGHLGVPTPDFLRLQAEQAGIGEHVFAAGVVGIKADAELQQRLDAAARGHDAGSGPQHAGDDFQERALAAAVAADDADPLAAPDFQRHVLQRRRQGIRRGGAVCPSAPIAQALGQGFRRFPRGRGDGGAPVAIDLWSGVRREPPGRHRRGRNPSWSAGPGISW